MNRHFKRKLKLKKNVVVISKVLLIFLLVIFIHNNKFVKSVLKNHGEKYVQDNYVKNTSKLSMPTLKELKDDNDKFAVKENKNLDPVIYLYNTHQTEKYFQDTSLYKPSVVHASKYLSEKFNENGLPSIVENRNIEDVLSKNGWSYGSSYKVSRSYLEDAYENNKTLKYFFDIHRDAGTHSYTTLCVDDKCYAKLLFLIGLENTNYQENQKYAEEISKRINNKVKGLSKGILQKQGKKVNGVYNEDFSSRLILIEVGGENNTIDEVYNTLNILSEVLIDYIKEEIINGR